MARHILTKEDSSKGGKNSKRPPFDRIVLKFLDEKSLIQPNTGKRKKLTNQEMLLMALQKAALSGNVQAIRELLDRAYGKAKISLSADITAKIEPASIIVDGEIGEDDGE